MSLWAFLKDRCLLYILHLVCMGVLSLFLKLTGYGNANIVIILVFWILILCMWSAVIYLERRRFFGETEQILQRMDKRYLLGELFPDSVRLEDRLYRDMIRRSNKSVIERIRQIEDSRWEYREYIEGWVHEVKAPITSISLLCENGRKVDRAQKGITEEREIFRTISLENQRIENYVDMALYYARSENVYKDFMIQKTDLQEIVEEILEKNRLLLIRNGVRAEVACGDAVYTDRKWIAFILNQIILNSVKYCGEEPVFLVGTKKEKDGVCLTVEDNGTGIFPEELSRIFDKGFTGSNGRDHERATGIGLYLCRKLCDKLGIQIKAESEYGRGTKMLLLFPVSHYISRGQEV